MNENGKIRPLVQCAMAAALIFLATFMIKIPNSLNGYLNLGDGLILLFAPYLSGPLAFAAAGLGSALADVAGGYAHYALFTLVIKGLEGLAVSWTMHRFGFKARFAAYGLGLCIMVLGYFLADWFLLKSLTLAAASTLGNLVQAAFGFGIAWAGEGIVRQALVHRL